MSFDPTYYTESHPQFAPTTDAEKAFEQLDASGVRWLFERALASEEEKQAGEGAKRVPLFVAASEDEIDDGAAEEEDRRDQAFGEDGEGERCPHAVGVEHCST